MISDNDIVFLQNDILQYVGDGKRYKHILSVCEEAKNIALDCGLEKNDINRVAVAALLHDITKKLNFEEQKLLYAHYNLNFGTIEANSYKILHQVTGAEFAAEKYGFYVDSEICDAIRCHTTARPNMTLIDKIIYLADYIEPTRTFDDCVELRKIYYQIKKDRDINDVLNYTIYISLKMTLRQLTKDGLYIHPQTVKAYNYYYLLQNSEVK